MACISNGIKEYHYALSDDDYFITVYRLFTTIFHKCINVAINVFYIIISYFPMFSLTHYAQHYVGIIGGPPGGGILKCPYIWLKVLMSQPL